MSKMKNRFIALLVVFTSIISFLPVKFGGQIANAATISADATTVQAYASGSSTPLTSRTDSVTSETIYTTSNVTDAGFDITVKNVTTTTDKLIAQVNSTSQSASGIIGQKIDIVSINGTPCYTDTANTTLNSILSDIGISISDFQDIPNTTPRIGKTIKGLPLGVNKIEYKITITTQTVDYVQPIQNADGTKTAQDPKVNTPEITSYANQKLTIEHATGYVTNKIVPMIFDAYVGKKSDLNSDTYLANNTIPFKYSTEAKPDSNMALRYTFDVPDSISTLEYNMTFTSELDLTNAKVYKNGSLDTSYSITDQTLTGNLETLGQSDIIVVKLDPSQGTDKTIQKAYAIEIRYNNLPSNQDYSLKNAGLTKLDYNDDDTVKAYIGKEFTVTKNDAGFSVYNGEIHLDSRARMISIDPTLIRSKSTVAYVVTNNYVDSSGTTQVKKSVLKNGKQFVDFMASTTKNQIQLDVYAGQDGNITDSSTILARYLFDVVPITGNDFAMDLAFTNSVGPYLTQPGVSKANNGEVDFTTSRRTYDLYYGASSVNSVNVSLALKANDSTYTGVRSSKNEYIRVFLADDVNSTNLKEATESVNNSLYLDSNNNYVRNTSIDVNLGTSKKMVVQAYYDEFEYDDQGNIKIGTDGSPVYVSHPIGDDYVFYLPENYDSSDSGSSGQSSDNAALNSLKINGYTLIDSNDNTGFSSDNFDYTTTVAKEDTTEKITAIAQDDNVKSIVASISGSDTTYDLASGEVSELPLNTSGTTTITIVVTAQDGNTTKTYTIVVKNNTKGSDANLKNVILNTGDYTFDPTEDVTKVRVDQTVSSIKVTPIPEDSKATASVNGEDYSGSAVSVDLKGAQKTEISIKVTSEDSSQTKTYTLEVYRVDAANWNNDSSSDSSNAGDDQFYDEYNDCWVDLTKYDEWGTVNGKPVYFDKKSRQVKNAWVSTGGKYYYLNNLGYRASGWKIDDKTGQTYYLDPTTGEMRKGWLNLNNTWYYLGLNGLMKKGWLYLNGKWYYFTPNGQMVVSQSMYVDDKVYNFGQDGAVY